MTWRDHHDKNNIFVTTRHDDEDMDDKEILRRSICRLAIGPWDRMEINLSAEIPAEERNDRILSSFRWREWGGLSCSYEDEKTRARRHAVGDVRKTFKQKNKKNGHEQLSGGLC